MTDEENVTFMGEEIAVLDREKEVIAKALEGLEHERYNMSREEKALVNNLPEEIKKQLKNPARKQILYL